MTSGAVAAARSTASAPVAASPAHVRGLGDGEGSDDLGYDLRVDHKRLWLLLEVKATTGDDAEFLLTGAELVCAQNLTRSERYEILFVTHVLDGERRRIFRLPNPLDSRSRRLCRTVGNGVRYKFALATPTDPDNGG